MDKKPSKKQRKQRTTGFSEVFLFALPRALGGVIDAAVTGLLRLIFGKQRVFTGLQPEVPESERIRTGNEGVFRGVVLATGVFIALALFLVIIGNFPRPNQTVGSAGFGFEEWQRVKAAETAYLDSYGWVDKEAGIVHIPIRDVIRKLGANNLLPSRPPAAATAAATTEATKKK